MDEENETLTIVTADNQEIQVNEEVAAKSEYLNMIIQDAGLEEKVKIPNIKMDVLKKVFEFCKHHLESNPRKIKKPLKSGKFSDVADEWDVKFLDIEKVEDIMDLILAADFLHVSSLMSLACAKIACLAYGQDVDYMRKLFDLKNDFTKEEEAELREQNKWAEK